MTSQPNMQSATTDAGDRIRPEPGWLHRSDYAWLLFLVVPPFGAIFLWRCRGVRLLTRILATVLAIPLTFIYLHFVFGLRVHFTGNMGWIIEFWSPSSHATRLERHRASMAKLPESPGSTGVAHTASSGEASGPAAAWPGFRGPRRDGIAADITLADWPTSGLTELWRQPVGEGHASFAIAHGRAYTIEQRRSQETVTCYELATGRELWAYSYGARFEEILGGAGPRATPTYDRGRLFALGALGDLHCFDAESGEPIWHVNILADNDAENVPWGMSGSPLVEEELVIVAPGGRRGKSVAAYDRATGQRRWRAGDDPAGYASPSVATLGGTRQVLIFSGNSISGHAIDNGRVLWRQPWETHQGINVCQPIAIGEDCVFVSSAYDHGSALIRLVPNEADFKVETVWETKYLKVKFSSAVLYAGHFYGLDEAILTCIDATTGQRRWKGGRYGYGQLLLAGDSLLIQAESGELVRVRASPERHEEIGRSPALRDKTWNYPAVGEGKVLVRNAREMACFELPILSEE